MSTKRTVTKILINFNKLDAKQITCLRNGEDK